MKRKVHLQICFLLTFIVITGFVCYEIEKGTASYYSNSFNGRKTASGEKFSNDSLTAAHKKLPFGTIVKVTNLKNDSVVILKINDRMPQSNKRAIDVSLAAAKKLNFVREGLTTVTIEILVNDTPPK